MGVSLKPMLVTGEKAKVSPQVSGKNVKTRQVAVREKRAEMPLTITRNDNYLIAEPPFARGGFGGVNYAIDVRNPQRDLVAKTMWASKKRMADGYEFQPRDETKIYAEINALGTLRGPLQLVGTKAKYGLAEQTTPSSVSVMVENGQDAAPKKALKRSMQEVTLLMTHVPGDMGKISRNLFERPVEERRVILRSMVAGAGEQLQQLHAGGFLHMDLKAENFLFDKDGAVCLADFGLVKRYIPGVPLPPTLTGTPHTMAPEVDRQRPITAQAEVWSLFMSWAHAAVTQNDFITRQELRFGALTARLKAKAHYEKAVELHFNEETKGQMPKELLDTLASDRTAALKHHNEVSVKKDPYDALAKWKKTHTFPLDGQQLFEESQTDPMSDFVAQLWHLDPEMCTLGFRDVLWQDPGKRISLDQFVQDVRSLQPSNSSAENEARNLLKGSLGNRQKVESIYAALREHAQNL